MSIQIKPSHTADNVTLDLLDKISVLENKLNRIVATQDILNQEMAFIQELVTLNGFSPSRYVTDWVFDPRLPFDLSGTGLSEILESEYDVDQYKEYQGAWISLSEINFTALLDTTRQLSLVVEVGSLHESIEDLELVCFYNEKLCPWIETFDNKFKTIISNRDSLKPSAIKLVARKIKLKPGCERSSLYQLKKISISSGEQ